MTPLLAFFAFLLTLPLGVIGHELAHAYACVCRGGIVLKISLGQKVQDSTLRTFQFLGFLWEVHGFPSRGLTRIIFFNAETYRGDMLSCFAAGPVFNMVCGLVALVLLLAFPFDSLINDFGIGWLVSSILLVLCSIIPAQYGRLASDGAQIIRIRKLSDNEIIDICNSAILLTRLLTSNKNLVNILPDKLISLYETDPNDIEPLQTLVVKLVLYQDPREIDYLEILVNHPRCPREVATLLDHFLTQQLVNGKIHKVPDPRYDLFSQKLVELQNNAMTVQGTRGSVLIDMGRIDEGKALLENVLSQSTSPMDQLFSHVYLAMAEERLGNLEASRVHAEKAKAMAPQSPVLARLPKTKLSAPVKD